MGQILHDILDYRNYTVQINAISGYALVFYEVGGIVGSSLSGKAVDLIKKHKMVMVFCMVLNVLSVIGLIVGRHFYSVITVMVCNTILGFSLCLCDIPIYDIILQQTHPKNSAFVILLFVGESKTLVIIFGLAGRLFYKFINETAALTFLSLLLFLSLCVSLVVKPKYNRTEACDGEDKSNENFSLLPNNNKN